MKKYVCIILTIISFLFILVSCNSSKGVASGDGTILVELIDLDGKKEAKEIEFHNGDSLIELLNESFPNFVISGTALMSIGNLKTDKNWNPYIAIYVDDAYAQAGIRELEIYDKMKLTFKMESW